MSKNTKQKDTHRYKENQSILFNEEDEYSLSQIEYYKLYLFFVTYSMCGSQSMKKRSFIDYGWDSDSVEQKVDGKKCKTDLGNALFDTFELDKKHFYFLSEKNNLTELFNKCNLRDGLLTDYDTERAVIGKTNGNNKYLKLFYRIRDGFAHGKFVLKYSSEYEKMVIIQDNDSRNVTARIVLKLTTLLNLIEVIDINGLITHTIIDYKETVESVV